MTRHTARVSRTGLAIIGLILLLGAGAVLARGLNASTTVLGNPHAARTRPPPGNDDAAR